MEAIFTYIVSTHSDTCFHCLCSTILAISVTNQIVHKMLSSSNSPSSVHLVVKWSSWCCGKVSPQGAVCWGSTRATHLCLHATFLIFHHQCQVFSSWSNCVYHYQSLWKPSWYLLPEEHSKMGLISWAPAAIVTAGIIPCICKRQTFTWAPATAGAHVNLRLLQV